MGVIANMIEKRSGLAKPEQWLVDFFKGNASATGKKVNMESALTLTAVYASVRILAESVASLPLPVYQRLDRGKKRAKKHHLYKVLHDQANSEMTAFTFWEVMMNHLALRGNAYANIEYDNALRIKGLWPLNPDKIKMKRNTAGDLVFEYILPNGSIKTLQRHEVFYIPGMGFDGYKGYDPITLAKEAIGMGLASEEYGARFFGNGAKPGGVVEHPNRLSEEAQERLRSSWNEMHQGLSKQHRIAILEEGMTYKQLGLAPENAQFLETRKFQIQEIARFFRVPPHMLADLERATFSNIEQQSIDFVIHSLRPWLVRIEQAINSQLVKSSDFFAEFIVDGLLRGDAEARSKYYNTMFNIGAMSQNDIREKENDNPVPGGDQYYVPLNMVPANKERKTDDDDKGNRSVEIRTKRQKQAAEIRRNTANSFQRIVKQAISKTLKREEADVMRQAKKMLTNRNQEQFDAWLSDFYRDHETFVEEQMSPIYQSIAESMVREAAIEVGGDGEFTRDLEEFVQSYLEQYVKRHNGISISQIRDAIQKAIDEGLDVIDSLQERFDDWNEKRVTSETQEETFRASNAFVMTAYVSMGVTRWRWVADADPCEYCRGLDGKVASVGRSFIQGGEAFKPTDESDAFTPSNSVRHGPLHGGCECTISAEQ